MATRKCGGAVGSPMLDQGLRLRLEGNAEAQLHLPHHAVGLQSGDDPGACAINAKIARKRIYGMVEDVEELRLELSLNSLGDGEVLEE